jgi:hypothetical protein
MLHNIFKVIRSIFRDENKEYERQNLKEFYQALKRKQESLKKFNGKMHVSERGGISIKFKSAGDKSAYYKNQLNSIKNKVNK